MIHLLTKVALALAILFGMAADSWTQTHAQVEETTYDPGTTMEALLAFPIPSRDIFWQGAFEEEEPDEAGVVRQAQILTVPGIITYRIYDGVEAAQE